jgi:hypothetical protein
MSSFSYEVGAVVQGEGTVTGIDFHGYFRFAC